MQNLIIFGAIITWLFIIGVINSFSKMAHSKKKYYDALTKNESTQDMVSRVSSTASFLKLMDTLISLETQSLIDSLQLIKQPYNILQLDKDIKKISEKTFNAIKKELYENDELCIESDFLLEFITTQVSTRFTEMVVSSNIGIYTGNEK